MNDLSFIIYEPGVYGVYKKVAWTPLEAILALKKEKPELQNSPLTYAGRLDPMAEGLLLILDSSVIKNKEDYLGLDKTYKADILLGVKTDSFDLLGLPSCHCHSDPPTGGEESQNNDEILHPSLHSGFRMTREKIQEALQTFIGEVSLPLPPYSSPPVDGKPLFIHAQQGAIDETNTSTRTSKIHSIKLEETGTITVDELSNYIHTTIPKVKGNFRTQEILAAWDEILKTNPTFQTITLTISCTSGTYIRSLAHELGKKLGTGACVYKLKRTQIGNYRLN